jgi:UDP-N-acetylmuramate dehydrogenase
MQDREETERKIQERMDHSKKHLSADKPSCGSVFCEGNRIVYRLLMGKRVGGAMYSKKTPDWISNMGNATASDVMALIEKGKKLHKLFLSRCKAEIRYIS